MPSERTQTLHRTLNTVLLGTVVVFGALQFKDFSTKIYEDMSGITEQKVIQSEIYQITVDEGYRACTYKDSLGYATVGFGILVEGDMELGECVDGHRAINELSKHYRIAMDSVDKRYPWANPEERLVLINLTYNMGETRLAKFKKTLAYFEAGEYQLAAGELLNSNYARQVPNRAGRMAGRIMRLKGE